MFTIKDPLNHDSVTNFSLRIFLFAIMEKKRGEKIDFHTRSYPDVTIRHTNNCQSKKNIVCRRNGAKREREYREGKKGVKENIKKPLRVKKMVLTLFSRAFSLSLGKFLEREQHVTTVVLVNFPFVKRNEIRNSSDGNKQHGMKKLIKYFPLSLLFTLFIFAIFSLAVCSFSVVIIAFLLASV